MVIGLGSGSTASWLVKCLGERIRRENLEFRAVATSSEIAVLAKSEKLSVIPLNEISTIDLTIDGTDEFDSNFDLVKGGGGALLGEKIVAAASDRLVIIADNRKQVPVLGKFPLPVEIVKFGWKLTRAKIGDDLSLTNLDDSRIVLRARGNEPFISDYGNYIVDLHLSTINNARQLDERLNQIPGVVENGLFVDYADVIVVGHSDGLVEIHTAQSGSVVTRKVDIRSMASANR